MGIFAGIVLAGCLGSGALAGGGDVIAAVKGEKTARSELDRRWSLGCELENDLFTGTDRHYTNGIRLTLATPEMSKIEPFPQIEGAMNHLGLPEGQRRGSLIIGQSMFTPSDIRRSDLLADDRPYAGWTYLGFGLSGEGRTDGRLDRMVSAEVDLGVIGPLAHAEAAQKAIHEIVGAPRPQGWHHQLKNEPGINLMWDGTLRYDLLDRPDDAFGIDVLPHAGASLGNVFTHGAAGAILRAGWGLGSDYGPPRIRPSLPGSYFFESESFGFYLFVGAEGRGILRNATLDGNSFASSHHVEKRPWVADLQFGFVAESRSVRLGMTQVLRTREFEGQKEGDRWGSVFLTAKF